MYIKPKKRLGQNFLIDKNIQRKIVDCLELEPSDIVLEIGSGRGELTGLIAQRVEKIYGLEIDPNLCKLLKDTFKIYSNIEIINQDVLRFNLRKYFNKLRNKIKVVGNIPYYISSPIIEHLISFKDKIDTIFITIQKEFASRIIAAAGSKDYSSFSCFVQYYIEPKTIFNIKKTCFSPSPKVDSCLVKLRVRTSPAVNPKNEKLFFKIIRAAFNKRRKTLRNSLLKVIPPQKLEYFFHNYNINSKIRPENLSLADFANLSNV